MLGKLFSRNSLCGCVHMFIEDGLGHSIQVTFSLPLSAFVAIETLDTVIFLVVGDDENMLNCDLFCYFRLRGSSSASG